MDRVLRRMSIGLEKPKPIKIFLGVSINFIAKFWCNQVQISIFESGCFITQLFYWS